MPITFEGDPPYDLPFAQSAEARSEGETVELVLHVSVPGKLPSPAPIRVRMTADVAATLASQLGPVSRIATVRARQREF